MLIAVAFMLVHESMALPPGRMLVLSALSVIVGGAWFTVMVTGDCALPSEFVAVNVYVVLALGETVTLPLSGNVSAPSISILGFTLTESAFVLFHVSVTRSPAVTVVLSAPAEMVAGETLLLTVTLALMLAE